MHPKAIRPDHVAIYIRWSTEDQSDGTTLAVQMEACKHYVASQGWLVRDDLVFIDDGYSGGSLDRPALGKLRQAVKDREVDCVVVFKLDRLSRSVIDTVNLVLQEWDDLTYVKSAREPIDTTNAMGKQFFYMLVSFAEWERNVIRERTFSGKLRRAQDGRSPGFPMPYGYRKGATPGTLALAEAEATVVRLVYQLAAGGQTVRSITRYLNQHGYASRMGAPWGTSMVSKMLHNPVYTGKLVWGRRRLNPRWKRAPGETRLKPAEPHVMLASGLIPAIITPEQFDAVQRLMKGNQKIQPAALGSKHLLTGLIKCARCHRAMQHNEYQRWAYYRCGGKVGQGLCAAPSVRARDIEERVIDALRERFAEMATARLGDGGTAQSQQLHHVRNEMRSIEERIARLDQQERRVNHDYRAERLTAEERRSLLLEVQREREELLRTLTDLREREAALLDTQRFLDSQMRAVHNKDVFRSLPVEEQKYILRFFIQEVLAEKGTAEDVNVTVVWRTV